MTLHIIILSYNQIDLLKQCINSIYANTNGNFSVFILDNGSETPTKEYLEKLTKDNLYINFQDTNLGIIKGRNICYQFSKNTNTNFSHILILDSDQILLPEWEKSYFELFNKKYDIVGKIAWKMRKDYYPYKIIKNETEEFNYVSCGGMMVKKEVIEDIGLFDERYEKYYWEDPDFIFRAHDKGYKIGWNYNPVIKHQKHNLSLSGERKKYFMENWKKFQEKWSNYKIPVFKMK
jgi:GT2 family glycosyltransferase